MPSKNSTTVVLNKDVQKLKNELAGIYGLKNLLSAGILLFSRQSDSAQKSLIKEVNQLEHPDNAVVSDDTGEKLYEKLKQHFQFEPGENKTQNTPAKEIVKMITDFRQQHSPSIEKSKRKPKTEAG